MLGFKFIKRLIAEIAKKQKESLSQFENFKSGKIPYLTFGCFSYNKCEMMLHNQNEMTKWFSTHVKEQLGYDANFIIYRRFEPVKFKLVWVWYAVTDFENEFGKWTRNTISIEENTIKYIVYGDGNNDAPH